MAQARFWMDTQNVFVDDAANTASFTLYQQIDWDAMPPGVTQGMTMQVPSVTLTTPIRKNTVISNQVFVAFSQSSTGTTAYTRWELVSGTWVNKGPCNLDGTQPVKA